MTRAALRAQEFQIIRDKPDAPQCETSSDQKDQTPIVDDAILSETSGNSVVDGIEEDMASIGKKTHARSKGRKVKKALKNLFANDKDQEGLGPTDLSVEAAEVNVCLPKDVDRLEPKSVLPIDLSAGPQDTPQEDNNLEDSPTETDRSESSINTELTPQTQLGLDRLLNVSTDSLQYSQTPKFDPRIHMALEPEEMHAAATQEDSFVDSIKTRSPSKQNSLSPMVSLSRPQDSFANEIRSRSPPKPALRIEDSVEAIDALEDALEEIAKELPDITEGGLESPVKTKHIAPSKVHAKDSLKQSPKVQKNLNSATLDTRKKAVPRKPAMHHQKPQNPKVLKGTYKKTCAGHPTMLQSEPSSNPSVNAKPRTTAKLAVKPSSISKPAFAPSRSTKPPTKATFTLPGEAVAARLKAQKEERLKREEEAVREKAQFKARPAPRFSSATLPMRGTAASKACQSIVATAERTKENEGPNLKAVSPTHSDLVVKKRQSAFVPSNVNPCKPRPAMNTSTLRPRPISAIISTSTLNVPSTTALKRTASVNGATAAPSVAVGKSTVTQADIISQRAKAKEIYGRERAMKEDMDRTKREKEEAAKKARAEAAERGRQASREWAERQKKKAMNGGIAAGE